MKLSVILCLCLFSAGGLTAPVDSLRDLIIGLRDQMPCGFPEYNLPALAPFLMDTLQIDQSGIYAKLDKFRLDGLNSFEIDELTLNILTFKMTYGFTFKEISLKTLYDAIIELGSFDIEGIIGTPKIFGNGSIDLMLRNLSLSGNLALQFHTGGSSSLKEFKIKLGLEEVQLKLTGLMDNEMINDFVSDLIVSVVNTFVDEMQPFISETLESLIIPLADSLLVNLTVSDILGWINGGGGEGPPKPPCIVNPDVSFLYKLK